MAKTYRLIQQWDRWLMHFLGQHVLAVEKKFLAPLIEKHYGKHVLLIGSPQQEALLKVSMMPNHFLLSPLLNRNHQDVYGIDSTLYELPIASGSVDSVMLPHVLELIDNPRQLLSEACRIIKPEGHIIILGFNPYSLWGIRKLWSRKKIVPWAGNFIQSSKVKKWLELADFELVKQDATLYRPPINNEKIFKKLKLMEWFGRKFCAPLGGIYVLIAQAKVVPLTPIKLRWKQKLTDMRLPAVGIIPRPTIRNPPQ